MIVTVFGNHHKSKYLVQMTQNPWKNHLDLFFFSFKIVDMTFSLVGKKAISGH